MTFLQPFMLFGLAAAAIPLVLHLLTLRRMRTIDFSTLEFLKELQRSRIRRLQLRQWLLLLLRTVLIVLLVLAFGRPTLRGTLPDAWGAAARSTAVLLVDDSYSMTAVDANGERIRRAKDAAAGIIRSLREGDLVAVFPFSAAQPIQTTSVHPVALDIAANIRPSAVRRPLEDVIRAGGEILSAARSANKELYVLSDMQATLLERQAESLIPVLQDPSLHCFLIPIGDTPVPNVSVASLRFGSSLVDLGRPFPLEAVVANRGDATAVGITVSLYLETERTDQRARDLAPNGIVDVSLSGIPRSSGFLTGRVVVEGDDIEFDDQRSFVIRLRQERRVLLIGSEEDLRYVRLALQSRFDTSSAAIRIETLAPDRVSESRLVGYDAYVVAAGHPELDRWGDRIKALIERGAGLVLIPGANAQSWGTMGDAFGLGSAPAAAAAEGSFIAFRSADLDHPVFDGMFEPTDMNARGRRQVPTPEIQRILPTRVPPNGMAVVTLSTGQPFLVELPVGQGRIIVLATAASTTWSDLPTQGLFVPLIHRALAVVAGAQEIRPVVTTGESVVLPVPPGAIGAAEIVTPDRRSMTVAPTATPVGTVLHVDGIALPGVYSVKMGGKEIDRFAAAVDGRETDTRPSTEEARDLFFTSIGLAKGQWSTIEPSEDIDRVVNEARLGTELWRSFLIAALFVAVAESILAARWKPVVERGSP